MYKYYLIFLCILCLAGVFTPAKALPAFNSIDNLKDLRAEAMQAYVSGKQSSALMLYDRALNLAVKHYGANSQYVASLYYDIGSLAFRASRFQQAENYLNRALQINPSSVSARLLLSSLLRLRGRPDQAEQEASKVLLAHHTNLAARKELAFCYLEMGKFSESTREFSYLNSAAHGNKAPLPGAADNKYESTEKQIPEVKTASFLQFNKQSSEINEKPKSEPISKPAEKKQETVKSAPKSREAVSKPKPVSSIPKKRSPHHTSRSAESESRSTTRGFVPPPPPVMPVYQPYVPSPPPSVGAGSPGFQLKTEAQINSKGKSRSREGIGSGGEPANGDNSDFLLDWASDKAPKKKSN